MHDAEIYDGWEPSRRDVTHRSYFYPLAPIGVGTAAVESLTGYISRLAAAHAVDTGVLINHELRPRIPCTKGVWAGRVPETLPEYSFYVAAHTLNGVGTRAQQWVSLLEQLTCVPRLALLTILPWAEAISCVHLLRTCRAWCPCCFGDESSSAQSAYERLLWAFQIVNACPVHRRSLESLCPSCGRTQCVLSSRSRTGYCSRCYCWLGRAQKAMPLRPDLAEQIVRAEMLGSFLAIGPALPDHFGLDLFRENVSSFVRDAGGYRLFRDRTQGLHVRDWIGRGTIPRMDSLARLSRGLNVCLARLFTERIDTGKKPDQKCFWKAHYRVASNAVEVALRAALQVAIPPALLEIANQLGYQSVASLQSRYPALCSEVASKRRAAIKASPPSLAKSSVPRERIETALIAALRDPGFTGLGALAVSVGLSSKRRLYKDFHDLRVAIVAKNATIKNRRLKATEATISTAIGAALGAAFNEQPVPTVAEVAQRLGYATAKPLTSRFPELTTELRLCRQRFRQVKCGHRVNERIRQRLTEALGEFPPPSCAEVVRSVCGHRTKIREAFQELWRALHRRYVEHVQEAYRVKREAFAREVYRAVLELHRQGVYPIVRLVLATIPQPQFRSREIVAETVRLARHELSVKPHEAYRGQRCSGAAVNCRTNSTFAETPNGVVRP